MRLTLSTESAMEGVYLYLPAAPAEVSEAFAWFERSGVERADVRIVAVNTHLPYIGEYALRTDIHDAEAFQKLNQLAETIERMDDRDYGIFTGALNMESINSLDDVIRLSEHLDDYVILPHIKNDADLCRSLLNVGLKECPKDLQAFLDFEAAGRYFRSEFGGTYGPGGYVRRKDEPEQAHEQGAADSKVKKEGYIMSADARMEEFEHIELFGKPALFTNERIDRNTVPKGWYCYDFRGSDSDPGKLNTVEPRVGVNHSGAVLLPEEIDMKGKDYRRVRGQINFLGDELTVREFCVLHGLECTVREPQFHIRPARPNEAGFFYALLPEQDEALGTIGHVRMDFGRNGNEFWHTWWPRGAEELNSPEFKSELQDVVDELRVTVLRNRNSMENFCYEHGDKIDGGYVQNYGYIVETEHYRYCLRCNPSPGDYNAYLTTFNLDVQRQNMAQKPLVGRVTFVNGDTQEFTDAEEYLQCIRDELPNHPVTGFRYETLTDDPAVRKAVDDILYDLYGEENPRPLEDYENTPEKGMTMGGM